MRHGENDIFPGEEYVVLIGNKRAGNRIASIASLSGKLFFRCLPSTSRIHTIYFLHLILVEALFSFRTLCIILAEFKLVVH